MKALLIAAALLAGCHSQAYYDEIAQRRMAIAEQKAQHEAEREKQREKDRLETEKNRKENEAELKVNRIKMQYLENLPPEYWLTRQAPVRYHPMTCPTGMVPDRDICIYRTW